MSKITIDLPQSHYDLLKKNAKDTHRSLRGYATYQLMKIANNDILDLSYVDELYERGLMTDRILSIPRPNHTTLNITVSLEEEEDT